MTVARILAEKGTDVVTTQPHRTLGEVAELLTSRDIGAVVVADIQGSVLGMLSERDIVRAVGRGGPSALNNAVSCDDEQNEPLAVQASAGHQGRQARRHSVDW